MHTSTSPSRVTSTLVALMVALVLGATGFFAQSVQAQTNDTDAQIQELFNLIAVLQAQLLKLQNSVNTTDSSSGTSVSEGGFGTTGIMVDGRVQTTNLLRVRSGAGVNASWINNVSALTQGSVVDGPRTADGYRWWHVAYDSGTSGWSAENWLQSIRSVETENNSENLSDQIFQIDSFSANVRGFDDIHGPHVDFRWRTSGAIRCSVLYGNTVVEPSEPADGSATLSRTLLREKYGIAEFDERSTFELRCQSAYTEKDSTVSAYKTLTIGPKLVEISSFKASVTDEAGPEVTLRWKSEGTSGCNAFLNGKLTADNLDSSDTHVLSRAVMSAKFGASYKEGNNEFELRCQSAYTGKDSTVSAYDTITLNQTATFRAILNDQVVETEDGVNWFAAEDLCKVAYNNYETYDFKGGDVLECEWNNEVFHEQDGWKG